MDSPGTSGNVSNSSSTLTILKGNEQSNSSRQYDTASWTFISEPQEKSNLAFLPIIAIIVLILGSLLKAYRWSRESKRRKAEGDVEFSQETEENYNIINIIDTDLSPVDVRCDGASVYDTVNSIRLLENGFAIQLDESHPYHDTVTSYKSLLMQKADGSQYDSVKSYKAFLQKVTQNKDLAVEVKLLENYPIRSKSAEHCVVLEEESSERSGEATTKMLGTLPLNKQLHKNGRFLQVDKKKTRVRRASGDPPSAMRKRSASNPTYRRRVTNKIGSLPSIRYTMSFSSDSDEDSQQSFMMDRKKLWAERKKLSRSTSGGKISKDSSNTVVSNGHGISEAPNGQKRVRHFSADGPRRPKRVSVHSNKNGSNFVNNELDLKDTQKTRTYLTKTMTKMKKPVDVQTEESSSENPASSNSSDLEVLSDAVASESDADTKRNTLLSTTSDEQTLDNDIFYMADSGAELMSSSEKLQNASQRPLSETKILIARAKEEFFKNQESNTLIPPAVMVSEPSPINTDNKYSNTPSQAIPDGVDQTSGHDNHSTSTDARSDVHTSEPSPLSKSEDQLNTSKSFISTDSLRTSEDTKISNLEISTNEGNEEPKSASSPQRVQRFQVTSVNNDIHNLSSE